VSRRFIGDGGRILQVVTNLIGNAIKFTPRDHVVVTVTCEGQTGHQAQMRVAVSDTGIGIPAEKISRLFEQFSQLDGSTTRNYGGTGLGLAISKRLVNLMGGTIGVASRPGEGSTFWFVLPLQLDSQSVTTCVSVDELRGVRMLIVDDDEVNRRLLQGGGLGHARRKLHFGRRGAPRASSRAPGRGPIPHCHRRLPDAEYGWGYPRRPRESMRLRRVRRLAEQPGSTARAGILLREALGTAAESARDRDSRVDSPCQFPSAMPF
jgi:hypothetical protein